MRSAAARTFCTAGTSRAINTPIIPITTSNSRSVNANRRMDVTLSKRKAGPDSAVPLTPHGFGSRNAQVVFASEIGSHYHHGGPDRPSNKVEMFGKQRAQKKNRPRRVRLGR